MPEFEFSGDSLESLGRDMHLAADKFAIEMDKTLAETGVELRDAAKDIAKRHSTTIPGSIRLVLVPGSAEIHAGGTGVPLAELYEFGNRKGAKGGRRKRSLTGPVTREQASGGQRARQGFAHPVFGNSDVWTVQESFPFLRPALAENRRQITQRMEKAWQEALRPVTRKE